MSGRDWQWPLEDGETLLWQGRPAPRCYIFRNWKLALAGTLLFFASSFWMMLAWQLVESDGSPWWLPLIPAPLVVISFYGPVSLLMARIRWERVFYALTEKRLLIRDGLFTVQIKPFHLTDLVNWQHKRYGAQLISLRLRCRNQKTVVLHCLEQPQNLLRHLAGMVQKPGKQGESV